MTDLQQTLNQWLDAGNAWIAQVFIIVLAAVIGSYLVRSSLKRLEQRLRQTASPWDDALVDALRRPAVVLIWIVGIAFAAEIVRERTGAEIFDAARPIRDVGVIGTLVWFLVRMISGAEENLVTEETTEERRRDEATVRAIAKLVRISVLITGALVGLQTLGFSISGVLAFGGIGGIAVGFAAKDLLANFFGGIIVYLDRPFLVGDWIRSPDRAIEGTVEHIGWRVTRIRTFDKRPLYVPNATFTSVVVENPSRMTNRRIYETIGIRYADAAQMPVIVERVEQMLREHPEIDQEQTLMVYFNAFGASSLDFFVYTFTRTTAWIEYHRVKQDVLFRIQRIIDEEGAEIAFPTSTVHLPDDLSVTMLQSAAASDTGNS
ncbi:mechanosensitive ion channel family protein [Sedimenticola sp.]|uniref:mechanosensitive ion channel family protein n=1 Tax=Sedimenticola sp. TaxID=1940285 RepID=UPI003D0A63E6